MFVLLLWFLNRNDVSFKNSPYSKTHLYIKCNAETLTESQKTIPLTKYNSNNKYLGDNIILSSNYFFYNYMRIAALKYLSIKETNPNN